jgi:Polysaccharide biosynthesis protein.
LGKIPEAIIFFSSGIASFVPRFDISFWKKIIKKSLPYGIALLLIRAIFKIDVQMIYFLRSSVEAGIYGIAITIIEVFSFLPIFFMNSVMPILSPAIKKNKEFIFRIG